MEKTSKYPFFGTTTGSPATGDTRPVIRLNAHHLRSARQWRMSCSHAPQVPGDLTQDSDPYLLVLLAAQELQAHRFEQAESLIDAAYAAYDQCRFGS